MSFFENTRRPEGLQFLNAAPDAKLLDCGCGGGANIRTMLKKCPNGEVKGVDYSPVSVEKAKKVNEDAILNGHCVILQGNVADLIFAANQFDLVTAFETVYFWPDLLQSFREVHRVLKPDGTFLICNECGGDNEKDEKWTERIEGMTIYKDTELKAALEDAKRQGVSTLIDIKVLPKTMTDGYDSWWNVGLASTTRSEKQKAAYDQLLANRAKARKY